MGTIRALKQIPGVPHCEKAKEKVMRDPGPDGGWGCVGRRGWSGWKWTKNRSYCENAKKIGGWGTCRGGECDGPGMRVGVLGLVWGMRVLGDDQEL